MKHHSVAVPATLSFEAGMWVVRSPGASGTTVTRRFARQGNALRWIGRLGESALARPMRAF